MVHFRFQRHPNHNGAISQEIIAAIPPNANRIRLAVAYIRNSGVIDLENAVNRIAGDGAWNNINKDIITCFDYGITQPQAIRKLINTPMTQVFIQNPEAINSPGFRPRHSFHPKVYEFRGDNTTNVVIGSANFTKAGWGANFEAIVCEMNASQTRCAEIDQFWNAMLVDSIPATHNLINDYRDALARRMAPVTRNIRFSRMVDRGMFLPQNYNNFWVDAGPMRSGESRNIVELSRNTGKFFGVNYAALGQAPVPAPRHIRLGQAHLVFEGQPTNCGYIYRTREKMERIQELPTNEDYAHTVMHFTRMPNGTFEVEVYPRHSDEAQGFETVSGQRNALFQMLGRDGRRFGFF